MTLLIILYPALYRRLSPRASLNSSSIIRAIGRKRVVKQCDPRRSMDNVQSNDKFLDGILPQMSAPLADVRRLTGDPCIIVNLESTMEHDYIGADSLKLNLESIEDALAFSPGPRKKSVVAVVLGSGGGKTRLLEECRRRLNEDNGTVVVAVTMNSHTSYDVVAEKFFPGDANVSLNMALSIVLRVITVVCNTTFEESLDSITTHTSYLDYRKLRTTISLSKFLRAAMSRVGRALDARSKAESNQKQPLKRLVLMIDEVMRLKEEFSVKGRRDENLDDHFQGFLSAMNKALLDEALYDVNSSEKLQSTLVISSLDVSGTGYTDSSREISMLSVPELSPDSVLSTWFFNNFEAVPKSKDTHFQLKLIAETLLGVPRLLEFARFYIVKNQYKVFSKEPLQAKIVQQLYTEVFQRIWGRYKGHFHSEMSEKNFALIYGVPTTLDELSSHLIRRSYFTRHPIDFGRFIPQGSLCMLAAYDARRANLNMSDIFNLESVNFNNDKLLFYNTFISVLKTISRTSEEGDALEGAGIAWLVARLVVARQVGMKSISQSQLFNIGMGYTSEIATPVLGSNELPFYIDESTHMFGVQYGSKCTSGLLPPISKDPTEYARLFNEMVFVNAKCPCKLYKSAPSQNYGGMLVSIVNGEIHVIFVDMKSKRLYKSDRSSIYDLDVGQYYQIHEVVKELMKLEASGVELSPVSKALVAGNFTFIFMTTHPTVRLVRKDKDGAPTVLASQSQSNIVVMLQSNTEGFMTLMWEFYRSARSMLSR